MDLAQKNAVAMYAGTTLATAKIEWDARRNQIRDMYPEIYRALYGDVPSHQVVDATIMAAKLVGAVKSFNDLFKSDDQISVGLSSLSDARPPKDMLFLVTHIALLYAVAAGTTEQDVREADYNLIPTEMRNGTLEIMQNKRVIFQEQEMERFYKADQFAPVGDTNANAGTPITYTMKGVGNVGLVKLENPKFIVPQEELEANMKFAKALPNNAAVKIILFGVRNQRV
jgi:hypothetical protein